MILFKTGEKIILKTPFTFSFENVIQRTPTAHSLTQKSTSKGRWILRVEEIMAKITLVPNMGELTEKF